MPANAAFDGVNDAAVTMVDSSWSNTRMLHSPLVDTPGAVHDSTPNTVGIAVSPSGKYAADTESVFPVVAVVAIVLMFLVHNWSAYW